MPLKRHPVQRMVCNPSQSRQYFQVISTVSVWLTVVNVRYRFPGKHFRLASLIFVDGFERINGGITVSLESQVLRHEQARHASHGPVLPTP